MDRSIPNKLKTKYSIRAPIPLIQKAMILYLVVWSISPPLSVDNIFRILALGCAVMWFVLELIRGTPLKRIHVMALIFMILVVLVCVIEFQAQFSRIIKQIHYYMAVMAFIMAYSYKSRWNELRFLIPVFLLLFAFFDFMTYRELLISPNLARMIAKADENIYPYLRRGVGGYELIYSQVLLFPAVLTWTVNSFKKNRLLFATGAFWIFNFALLILHASYSIAFVTVLSCLIIMFFYNRQSVVPAFIITLIIILLLILIIGYVDPIRTSLLSVLGNSRFSYKINDIYDSIHGLGTAESIASRIRAYTRSLDAIFDYPFIGGLWFGTEGGGHSAILDTFAKYGIFGGTVFATIIFYVPLNLKRNSSDKTVIRMANALLIALSLIAILNTVPYNMMFPIIMMTPMLVNDVQRWRETNEDTLDSKPASKRFVSKIRDKIGKSGRLGGINGKRADLAGSGFKKPDFEIFDGINYSEMEFDPEEFGIMAAEKEFDPADYGIETTGDNGEDTNDEPVSFDFL